MGKCEYAAIGMNEDFFEQVVIGYLVDDLGCAYLHGPDVERTSKAYEEVFV